MLAPAHKGGVAFALALPHRLRCVRSIATDSKSTKGATRLLLGPHWTPTRPPLDLLLDLSSTSTGPQLDLHWSLDGTTHWAHTGWISIALLLYHDWTSAGARLDVWVPLWNLQLNLCLTSPAIPQSGRRCTEVTEPCVTWTSVKSPRARELHRGPLVMKYR